MLLPVDTLLPSISLDPKLLSSHKFRQVRASIAEIGLIEPLAVTSVGRKSGQHMVLDGHLRLQVLKELGHQEVACLVANDDEAFTYNNHISRLSTVQEHLMIRRALERGISKAKLAKGLCIEVSLALATAMRMVHISFLCQRIRSFLVFFRRDGNLPA